jgi:alpha/beta superfamily hydrolase
MSLFLEGPVGRLEAKLWLPADGREPRAACVVCHPHPLGGGTMDTTAVYRTARGLEQAGLAVLRFNFRGVKKSDGEHDGHGAEELDLAAALDWMQAQHPDLELWAAGFSFGSRTVASRVRVEERVKRILLVALPVREYDCSFLREVRQPGLIVMAEHDEFGTLTELREQFPDLSPALELDEVPDTDHFFTDKGLELQGRVQAWAERVLARREASEQA